MLVNIVAGVYVELQENSYVFHLTFCVDFVFQKAYNKLLRVSENMFRAFGCIFRVRFDLFSQRANLRRHCLVKNMKKKLIYCTSSFDGYFFVGRLMLSSNCKFSQLNSSNSQRYG